MDSDLTAMLLFLAFSTTLCVVWVPILGPALQRWLINHPHTDLADAKAEVEALLAPPEQRLDALPYVTLHEAAARETVRRALARGN